MFVKFITFVKLALTYITRVNSYDSQMVRIKFDWKMTHTPLFPEARSKNSDSIPASTNTILEDLKRKEARY